jgi:hypothetical protein
VDPINQRCGVAASVSSSLDQFVAYVRHGPPPLVDRSTTMPLCSQSALSSSSCMDNEGGSSPFRRRQGCHKLYHLHVPFFTSSAYENKLSPRLHELRGRWDCQQVAECKHNSAPVVQPYCTNNSVIPCSYAHSRHQTQLQQSSDNCGLLAYGVGTG